MMKYKNLILSLCGVAGVFFLPLLRSSAPQQDPLAFCPFPQELRTFGGPFDSTVTAVGFSHRQGLDFTGGGKSVSITRSEREGLIPGTWEINEYEFSTDLQITDVAHRLGGEVLLVSGIRQTGAGCEDVVERWKIKFPRGSHVTSAPTPTVRGIPSPMPIADQLVVSIAGGGAYISPSLRRRPPTVEKTVLYSGSGLGPIAAIGADPEGRFVLFVSHTTGNVYSLASDVPTSLPMLEVAATQYPQLASCKKIYLLEHMDLGRGYVLSESKGHLIDGGSKVIVLRDADNDGLIDGVDSFTSHAEYMVSPWSVFERKTSLINTTDTRTP